MNPKKLQQKISRLLDRKKLAVLSTCGGRGPYASLVAFHYTSDLRCIYFATTRATRKYANLMHQPQVAFLIDSRTNREEDFHRAEAVTVIGRAEEFEEQEKQTAAASYLRRHPYLQEFIEAPTTAFFAVRTEDYIYVSNFQEVFELRIDHAPDTSP
jgi:nitroimidazol reductase NimA-like FMN-containing flavoprotein (pyridoxamine 5'-phosphate oxidase superfamily)